MPIVLVRDGFEFEIRRNEPEFESPHVHVYKGNEQAKISIGVNNPPKIVRSVMRKADLRSAYRMVVNNQEYFLAEWRKIHGEVEYRRQGN